MCYQENLLTKCAVQLPRLPPPEGGEDAAVILIIYPELYGQCAARHNQLVEDINYITFELNQTAYNNFINEMAMDNKVVPAHNYLIRIVLADSKEALTEVLKCPVAALQLAGRVNEIYAPELEIEVKN